MGKAGTTLPRARGICLVLTHLRRYSAFPQTGVFGWLRGVDLNHRPLGYEPNELPDCSTPRIHHNNRIPQRQTQFFNLGRWQASTILLGSKASLSICSSMIVPSLPMRKFTRRAALYLST